MNLISQILVVIAYLFLFNSCSNLGVKKTSSFNKVDTLNIGYSDTFLIGEQLFPTIVNSSNLSSLIEEKILLFFESDNYYYVFYNKKKKADFLSNTYWNQLMPKYIDCSINDGLLSYSRFSKVNYYDPFLTAFYDSKDSIIITGFDLGISDLQNQDQFQVNYFSTSDTLLELNKKISVGESLENVLAELYISNNFKGEKEFELVLMEATTQVDNAWYKDFPDYCSDYSIAVILSIKNNKLARIQYLNAEYIDYIFKQKKILAKDIHYH